MEKVKVVIAHGESRLELEGEQTFVTEQLKTLLPLITGENRQDQSAQSKGKAAHVAGAAGAAPGTDQDPRRQSIRTFVTAKAPQNVYEAIALVLHHRRNYEDKQELTAAEIRQGLVAGGARPPTVLPQALTDCRRRYGYIQIGSKRGFWKLTPTGETMIEFDLPRKAP